MKTPSLIAAVALALSSAAAIAGDYVRGNHSGSQKTSSIAYAQVVDVKPLVQTIKVEVPVRECYEKPVRVETQSRRNNVGRTIAGGLIGGVIGRQFGDGRGRDAMTVLGTVVGAASASERNRSDRDYEVQTQRYCETRYEYETRERVEAYRVTYVLDGQTYVTRTKTDPGDEIRVRVSIQPLVN